MVVAAVAAGAFAAAAAGQTLQTVASADSDTGVTPLASARDASAALGVGGDAPAAPELLPVARNSDASAEVQKLTDSSEVTQARIEREAEAARKAAEEAARPKTVLPAQGRFTSGFGMRWGAPHYGIDIANAIGTPIVAAADGKVIEAGPASGFGLWVKIRLSDGTTHVYGHMHSYSVRVGQNVKAGEKIAEIGNRGQSTGPHLHFEVWTPDGRKVDPRAWLAARGVSV
ncbi:Murein DD-endopeptidase MepM and murein hydrolase activator NlpD, contain LysM domain [Amycolatopsis arida]|uniref:Murein DD-endopeptidase MepM and murein hydrolase activator NlpD, contain LysM domain n=1 Tax=Amycolatopsis arida TaxID=587909 RepID=A0A1I5WXH6_9PSEU|nr:murein DD-endopeptidase MepM/ murein hydrolase activator NlpD [Amycolatopsis arida]SFQ24217.1 Murein DD-endopeptidase MepM and murein hydrolase activator NlpD, contain LysM domain [Amycolatopsis arida]